LSLDLTKQRLSVIVVEKNGHARNATTHDVI
jgi:hypothetical protein